MSAHWPQVLMIAWWFLTLGSKLGVAATRKTNWPSPVTRALEIVVSAFVLFEGGFFSPLGWSP